MKHAANKSAAALSKCKTSSRPRILLLAYSISPTRGSEYSVGWNHVKHLSEFCDLTVLYGLAGPHMGDLEEIEDYLRINGEMKNVNFVPIRPNGLARFLNAPNRAGFLVYSFYLAYRIWHLQAAQVARARINSDRIDLIHYLCPIGYREPSFLWKLDKPFIWGPIGGLTPTRHLKGAPRPWKALAKVKLKNLVNRINLAVAHRVSRALASADTVIAATSENQKILQERFGVTPILMSENAISEKSIASKALHICVKKEPVRLIWIGSLDWRKSPDLLLDAMNAVGISDWTLDIVGTGALRSHVEAQANELGLVRQVTFHGNIPRTKVQELLHRADLHLITSMGEGTPTTIWEAMAAGVPTLTLDHCGMHDVVCGNCGVRIALTDYVGTRDRIANTIVGLINDRSALLRLTEGVVTCRSQHLWSKRSQDWLEIYEAAIARAQG
ncbi:glycosyltransferase [Sulfitobacter pseudonitzschiae]|uniref:Glycosyltransferase n=1 Tax=Pseudosulfitobacter pseudonitzschiae TaxID=1402135 RepID=A0A9Q2NUJ7_9RHOB|nr:glycosyltransferase [Pseudosulfitobacter pseudonitzschiae]MBM2294564.1 glycosyltransferase [Pseudosulfitobacter pseudonitzschiae]MBM2299531.1 glycosyltransferase [Pseudosulfitobacter pseudonitzschiae]MBM2304431.1 glycosyltransferase [Pseudosulfitobacter pseudonitzschiae]MBM2314177.1 glycosyltransferase [Pseudosulfitobacter pseudonitzschiae]MBM2319092.1 glycosyltransferase [Pseudosulfitobacter pseudonitzschiae]